jgi:hypothetical protein
MTDTRSLAYRGKIGAKAITFFINAMALNATSRAWMLKQNLPTRSIRLVKVFE